MTCAEVRARLPEEDPDTLAHLRDCNACRREKEAYQEDLVLLKEGLLGLSAAAPTEVRPAAAGNRRYLPLAAAAAMLLGILALVLRQAPSAKKVAPTELGAVEQTDPETARRRGEALRNLADLPVRRAQVVSTSEGSGYLQISAGKTSHIQEGDEFAICRKGVFIAKVVVTRVDELAASVQVAFREAEPRLGDEVFESVPIPPAERKAALDYLFSFRPAGEEKDRAALDAAILGLGSEDAALRKKSQKDLVGLGATARRLLEKRPPAGLRDEARASLKEAQDRWAELEELLGGPGVERDLEYLSTVEDPRAYERLKRILSGVRPFSKDGFPERGSGLAPALRVWWEGARARIGWNAEADRYEERNP
jgi:hypothetical protein